MHKFFFTRDNQYEFKEQVELEITKNTSLFLKIDATIDENCFRNICLVEGCEINIERYVDDLYKVYKVSIYSVNKSREFSLAFGCELETCIVSSKCISNIRERLSRVKEFITYDEDDPLKIPEENKQFSHWKGAMVSYLTTVHRNASEEFKNRFPKIYIVYRGKKDYVDFIFDMKEGVQSPSDGNPTFKDYKNIIITRDESVICGDTTRQHPEKMRPSEKFYDDSFHCEIVTPILRDVADLELIYDAFFVKDCLRGNVTAGFHVNVSILDKKERSVYMSDGFIDCFLDLFEEYEEENYDKFRPEGSWYAKKILDYARNFTYKYMRPVLDFKSDEEEADFYGNFIEYRYYRSFVDFIDIPASKYNSFRIKDREVVEFRLYPSIDEYPIAIEYTKEAMKLLQKAAVKYSKFHHIVIDRLQRRNLEYKISHNPISKFEGYLYVLNDDYTEMLDLTDISELEDYVEVLFRNHTQKLTKFTKKKKNLYIATVNNLADGKEMKYAVEVYDDFRVKITKF